MTKTVYGPKHLSYGTAHIETVLTVIMSSNLIFNFVAKPALNLKKDSYSPQ